MRAWIAPRNRAIALVSRADTGYNSKIDLAGRLDRFASESRGAAQRLLQRSTAKGIAKRASNRWLVLKFLSEPADRGGLLLCVTLNFTCNPQGALRLHAFPKERRL
jgi:hypothetical protein